MCHFVSLKQAYSHKIISTVKVVPMSTNSRSSLLLCYFLFKYTSCEIAHSADFRCSAQYANCQLYVDQNSPYKNPFLRYKQDIISLEQFHPLSSAPALVTSILLLLLWISPGSIKLCVENIGEKILWHSHSRWLNMKPKAKEGHVKQDQSSTAQEGIKTKTHPTGHWQA